MATQKSTTSRTAKKSAAEGGSQTTRKRAASKRGTSGKPARQKRSAPAQVAQQAAASLAELIGKEVEGVTSLERRENGWSVEVDVVELRRIPGTTDVLATYEVDVDDNGELEGYRRSHRYVRGVVGEE